MYTQKSVSSSERSATGSDEDPRRRRSHSKDASFLGLSKAALRFFKLSNFACNARTGSEAAVDGEAHTGKKSDDVRRKWRFLKPRAGGDEGSVASQTGRSGELARCKSRIKSELSEKNPHDEEEATAVEKKREETLFDMLLSEEEDCANGSTIGKSNVGGSDKIVQFLTSDDGPVELQKEAPYYVSGNAKKHGDGEASFNGQDACGRVLMDQQGQKEECGEEKEEEEDVFGTGKKPDAVRCKWRFLEPREEANEGFASSQTGDIGEFAHLKDHVKPELGEMKPRHGEEVNAVDKRSKETLFDMLLREEEDSAGRSTIDQRNEVGSDKIMNCTLSQFLIRDDGPVELQKEASNYDTWDASKNGDGETSFKVHDAGGRVLMDQQGHKEECGDEQEVLNDRSTDIVKVSAGSKDIKAQRNPRTKYSTFGLLRELARLVPADKPVSIYVSKMLCAVGRARDLFQPILFRVNLKKDFLILLSASHASLAAAKMRKSLKHDTGAPAPEEMWTKEIIMGRRCQERNQEGPSSRWSNAKELPVTCHAEALERCYSFKELMEMADKF